MSLFEVEINDVIDSLESLKDEKRIEFAKRTYPTDLRVIGVTNPNIKLVLKELKSQVKEQSPENLKKLAVELCATDIFECQHMGLELVGRTKKVQKTLTREDIYLFCRNMDNWVSVDCYSGYFSGYGLRVGLISLEDIRQFYKSEDFWMRRIAIVSTVALNLKSLGGQGSVEITLEVCSWAVDDHHDMINKAMSWALRELSKTDKAAVVEFLETYESRLHKRVLREVNRKLETGRKSG